MPTRQQLIDWSRTFKLARPIGRDIQDFSVTFVCNAYRDLNAEARNPVKLCQHDFVSVVHHKSAPNLGQVKVYEPALPAGCSSELGINRMHITVQGA